jgi:hypothetical protein
MTLRILSIIGLGLALWPAGLNGQSAQSGNLPDITGTWQVETPDGPQTVVVRPDSSASFGEETIRWRVVPDTVYLAFGDEWIGYNFALRRRTLTLSGGDLEEPYDLKRVGPPTPLPEGLEVPPAPPTLAGTVGESER